MTIQGYSSHRSGADRKVCNGWVRWFPWTHWRIRTSWKEAQPDLGCVMQEEALIMKLSCQKCELELIKPLGVTTRLLFILLLLSLLNDQIILKDFVYPCQLTHIHKTMRIVHKFLRVSISVKKKNQNKFTCATIWLSIIMIVINVRQLNDIGSRARRQNDKLQW